MPERKPDRVLRPEVTAEKFGVTRKTIYEWAKTDPTFPKKIQLGRRAVGFWESELDDWANSRQTGGAA